MTQNASPSNDASGTSNKWLVRFLIIIGIGIPVVLEIFTFTGLFRSHLLEDNNQEAPTEVSETETSQFPEITNGDTLFANSDRPFLVNDLHLKIYPDKWVLAMGIRPLPIANPSYSGSPTLLVSSLRTNQRTIDTSERLEWNATDTTSKIASWELKSSEKPVGMNVKQPPNLSDTDQKGDTTIRYFKFGHVEARYYK